MEGSAVVCGENLRIVTRAYFSRIAELDLVYLRNILTILFK